MTVKVTLMTFEELLANNAALSGEVQRTQEALKIALLTIDKLKVELLPAAHEVRPLRREARARAT